MRRGNFCLSFRGFSPTVTMRRRDATKRRVSRCDEETLLKRFEILDAGAGVEDDDGLVGVDEVLVDQFS